MYEIKCHLKTVEATYNIISNCMIVWGIETHPYIYIFISIKKKQSNQTLRSEIVDKTGMSEMK